MQGIVLAIIISTLSPEGMNGATAALCLSAKPLRLLRAPALFSKKYTPSSKAEEWWNESQALNCRASVLTFADVQVQYFLVLIHIDESNLILIQMVTLQH